MMGLAKLAFPPDITRLPRPWRRAFLITLPVSGLLWVAWSVVGFVVAIICLAVVSMAYSVAEMFSDARNLWGSP